MFTKRIIPCLDVNNGRVVKGVNFVILRMPVIRWRLPKLMMQQEQMNWFFLISLHPVRQRDTVVIWYECCSQCIYPVYSRRRNPYRR